MGETDDSMDVDVIESNRKAKKKEKKITVEEVSDMNSIDPSYKLSK